MTKPISAYVVIFFFLTIFSFTTIAQKMPIKFGKVSIEELEMMEYDKDSNASAVILCDFGKTYFQFNENDGFLMHFKRTLRIKIFNKEAYDWANWKIKLWNDGHDSDREKVIGLRGFTFNLVDGKSEKSKLTNDNEFIEEIHDNLSSLNFTMPNVVEGSVIEIEYTIVSPFAYNLQDWYFQYNIPVVWSEYHVFVPEYYTYNHLLKGYIPLHVNDAKTETNSFTYIFKSRSRQNSLTPIKTSMQSEVIQFQESHNHYVAKDVPAFIVEEPLTSKENFISKIEFELSTVELPYSTVKKYSESWESINKKLMLNNDFGYELKGCAFLNNIAEGIIAKSENDQDKLMHSYSFIKNKMNWNERYSIYVDSDLRSAFNKGNGNIADINLMLVVLLSKVGLTTHPVVLSTRSNGMVHPAHPTMSGFNYVVAQTEIEGNKVLLDASIANLPPGMLPIRALNGKGRLISNEGSEWVELQNTSPYESLYMYNLKLEEGGLFTGSVQSSQKGYAAYRERNNIDSYVDEDQYIKELEEDNSGLEITSYTLKNRDELSLSLKGNYAVTISNQLEEAGNMIYFKPMFYDAITENPFKLEERNYPVEYPYSRVVTYMLNFTIPEGYVVDDKPEDAAVSLPDNAATFIFRTTVIGNMVQVVSKYTITQLTFIPEDYEFLKEFNNMIINKHEEQIVLVKE